jgi:hypothetical protein
VARYEEDIPMNVQTQELYELYRRYSNQPTDALRPLKPMELGLSNPLLIDLPHDWENLRPKLMIIGQQTYGWGSFGEGYGDDLIAGLMQIWQQELSARMRHLRSVFPGPRVGMLRT